MRRFGHAAIIVVLTLLTQLGGLAWLASLWFRRRRLAFLVIYAALWLSAFWLAPMAGRQALPCFGNELRMQSPLYCLLMRNYATPELASVASDAARTVSQSHPGSTTLMLDAGFPFLNGMPLLPHLSHNDGRKIDFAFYYQTPEGEYLAGSTRSIIGYWAFETQSSSGCPRNWITGRWDLAWLQGFWPDRRLDPLRTTTLAKALLADPRIKKVFLEPDLASDLGLSDPKLRFQGCRAARHDDHIHAQL